MSDILDVVLLVALPASGKSEVRKYLSSLPPEVCRREFHLGPTVQLDDFPYVHLMRRIDEVLGNLGQGPVFFEAPDRSFCDPFDWGTLIQLLNEDHADTVARRIVTPPSAAQHLLDRLDAAALRAGARTKIRPLPPGTRARLAAALEDEAARMLREKHENYPDTLEGRTVVIEFARGGPHGSSMPLPAPYGYAHSLRQLAPEILQKASLLYIWVTPEESRRKNQERADPRDPGSILHHSVPLPVMLGEYGCDDIGWLLETSDRPDSIRLEAHGRTFYLPAGRFDNRVDRTSFLRKPEASWLPHEVEAVHSGLRDAFTRLARGRRG